MVPIAIESHGAWGPSAQSIISALGMRITAKTGEPRASSFLFQSISLEVQRGNCRLLAETYAKGERLSVEEFEDAEG